MYFESDRHYKYIMFPGKFDVDIPEDMHEAEQGLDARWRWYLDLLKSGEEMLATSKVKLDRRKTLPFQAFMVE